MKKSIINITIVALALLTCLPSCFREPDSEGFLSDNIFLQGGDTMYVALGAKIATNTAWLDESTLPCKFKIVNVRKKGSNERVEEFFIPRPTRLWTSPYDYLTDKTLEDVLAKLQDAMITPLMINEVNGQLRAMDSTADMEDIEPGDIFHVDVSVTNSKETKVLKDYVVIKIEDGGTSPFIITDFVNGICVTNAAGENTFPYYDQINGSMANFEQRRNNIYTDNGTEKNFRVHKVSDSPAVGVRIMFKIFDKNGDLFDPATYATYSTTTSYIDHSVNRVNSDEDGMVLEFPVTPWPVNTQLYSYISGPSYPSFDNLDAANLKTQNLAGTIPSNVRWPDDNYAGMIAWYARVRSMITFYESGTWEISVKVPFATAE